MPPAGSFHPSPHSSQGEYKKLDDVEDDKQSTMSRASGVPRAEHALDALRLVAGNRVRHARCAPEFLEEIATKGAQHILKRTSSKNCKVICGSDARSAFKDYMRYAYCYFLGYSILTVPSLVSITQRNQNPYESMMTN